MLSHSIQAKLVADAEYLSEAKNESPDASSVPCQTDAVIPESIGAIIPSTQPEAAISSEVLALPCQSVVNVKKSTTAKSKLTCPDYRWHPHNIRRHCFRRHLAKRLGPGVPFRQISQDDVPVESEMCSHSSRDKLVADAEYLSESQNKSSDASVLRCQTESEIPESVDVIMASSQPDAAVSCSPATNGYQQCFT